MSAVVVYTGHAPAVSGGGFVFPHGEPVIVPADLAETLGSAFIVLPEGDEGE